MVLMGGGRHGRWLSLEVAVMGGGPHGRWSSWEAGGERVFAGLIGVMVPCGRAYHHGDGALLASRGSRSPSMAVVVVEVVVCQHIQWAGGGCGRLPGGRWLVLAGWAKFDGS